jgi:hypothetical protein
MIAALQFAIVDDHAHAESGLNSQAQQDRLRCVDLDSSNFCGQKIFFEVCGQKSGPDAQILN